MKTTQKFWKGLIALLLVLVVIVAVITVVHTNAVAENETEPQQKITITQKDRLRTFVKGWFIPWVLKQYDKNPLPATDHEKVIEKLVPKEDTISIEIDGSVEEPKTEPVVSDPEPEPVKSIPQEPAPAPAPEPIPEPVVEEPTTSVVLSEDKVERFWQLVDLCTADDGSVDLSQFTSLGEKKITGYCPCSRCCGKWAGSPTACGLWPEQGRTCAMSSTYKFGTVIYIDGLGFRMVEDRGNLGSKVDVFMDSHNACYGITGTYNVYLVWEP